MYRPDRLGHEAMEVAVLAEFVKTAVLHSHAVLSEEGLSVALQRVLRDFAEADASHARGRTGKRHIDHVLA